MISALTGVLNVAMGKNGNRSFIAEGFTSVSKASYISPKNHERWKPTSIHFATSSASS